MRVGAQSEGSKVQGAGCGAVGEGCKCGAVLALSASGFTIRLVWGQDVGSGVWSSVWDVGLGPRGWSCSC